MKTEYRTYVNSKNEANVEPETRRSSGKQWKKVEIRPAFEPDLNLEKLTGKFNVLIVDKKPFNLDYLCIDIFPQSPDGKDANFINEYQQQARRRLRKNTPP